METSDELIIETGRIGLDNKDEPSVTNIHMYPLLPNNKDLLINTGTTSIPVTFNSQMYHTAPGKEHLLKLHSGTVAQENMQTLTASYDTCTNTNMHGDNANNDQPSHGPSPVNADSAGKKPKVCVVCGDRAFGFNFNAVTCESCKAFFRRSANKVFKSRCIGKCEVTVESRSYCKYCRLKRCFDMGMKKEIISCSIGMRKPGKPSKSSPSSTTFLESKSPLQALTYNPQEFALLEELEKAYDTAFAINDTACFEAITNSNPSALEFINLANTSVMKIIKMAKNIKLFKELYQEDQIALLKGGVIEIMILRSTSSFDPESNVWNLPGMPNTQSDIKKTISGDLYGTQMLSKDMYQEFLRFMSKSTLLIQNDKQLIAFLMIISLFSSDRENVKYSEAIENTQNFYSTLMTKYIGIKYPGEQLLLAKALQLLTDIRDMSRIHATSIQNGVDSSRIDPLLVEVLNLP